MFQSFSLSQMATNPNAVLDQISANINARGPLKQDVIDAIKQLDVRFNRASPNEAKTRVAEMLQRHINNAMAEKEGDRRGEMHMPLRTTRRNNRFEWDGDLIVPTKEYVKDSMIKRYDYVKRTKIGNNRHRVSCSQPGITLHSYDNSVNLLTDNQGGGNMFAAMNEIITISCMPETHMIV
jgi:hypothetical protein